MPTILVADDDRSIRELLRTLLSEEGYQTLTATNGLAAVELARECRPDIAVLDVMMPVMDGLSACRAIKSERATSDIPVILLTALAQTPSKVEGLDCGATDYITKPFDARELLARLRTILGEKRRLDTLAAEAVSDPLTALANRRGLDRHLNQMIAHSERTGEPLSVAMFDADRFKSINDRFGHDAGDAVLATVAERAREALRSQDVVGRYGGEEFLAILPAAGREAALAAAERLRAHIAAAPVTTIYGPIGITVTVGVATAVPGADIAPAELVAAADRALFAAKRAGRNRVAHTDGPPTAPLAYREPPEAARALLEVLSLARPEAVEHAWSVADTCWSIATAMRLTAPDRNRVALAGLLHNIGELIHSTVPAGDKIDPPHRDAGGLACHVSASIMILERVPALSDLADILASFQEQCEGRSEASGGSHDARSLGSRIIAVAHAWVTFNRDGSDPADVAPSLRLHTEPNLDPNIVEVVLHALR